MWRHNLVKKAIFLEKSYTNVVEKLVPNPFMKSQNWAYLQINSVKFYTASFHCMSSWGLLQYFETKLQTTCEGLILSFFEKQKKRSGISCLIFWIVFKENVYFVMFYHLTKLIALFNLLREILGNICITILC